MLARRIVLLKQGENGGAGSWRGARSRGHEQEREGSQPIVFERIGFLGQGRASF